MTKANMKDQIKFYKNFDIVKNTIIEFLNNYSPSKILQEHFYNNFVSLVYGNLIEIFFTNLNQENVKELNLPKGKIGHIKKKYASIRKDAKAGISQKSYKVDAKYYERFKLTIKKEYTPFSVLFHDMEELVDIEKLNNYVSGFKKELKNSGKQKCSLHDSLLTATLEVYIQKNKTLPTSEYLKKIIKNMTKDILPSISTNIRKSLDHISKDMLNSYREYQASFELRFYKRWKTPIDLLECLIKVSEESGEEHRKKVSAKTNSTNEFKHEAMIKIHARSIQIAREILTLVKSGFADGAIARWRSLHELAVISFFLLGNGNEVSKRYLEFEVIKIFKEAKDYRAVYKKLGYPPIERKEFNRIKREHDRLIAVYGREFEYKNGFEWIPISVLSNRNFRAVEEHVKVDALHPFYNLSCNSLHGGSRGFYRLGLMNSWQDKILLVGSTDYGHADPIQNTALSIVHISVCLLNIEPDFESIIVMHILNSYSQEIGDAAVKVQSQL